VDFPLLLTMNEEDLANVGLMLMSSCQM
jgi:hypothetical protein